MDSPAEHVGAVAKADYHRHLANEVLALLPYDREEAYSVLRLAVEILQMRPQTCPGPPQIPGTQASEAKS